MNQYEVAEGGPAEGCIDGCCFMIVLVDDDGTRLCSTYDIGRSGICAIMKVLPAGSSAEASKIKLI